MNWFNGEIANAIKIIKQKKQTLLVLATDEKSSNAVEAFSPDNIAKLCQNSVCLHLVSATEPYKQFSSIYPVDSVPSVHLISSGGVRLSSSSDFNIESLSNWLSSNSPSTTSTPIEEPETVLVRDSLVEEKKRRQTSKDLQALREQEHEREIRQRIEDQKKDKEHDKVILATLRRQLEEDRREKASRERALNAAPKLDTANEDIHAIHERNLYVPSAAARRNFTQAKIQLRMSTGEGCSVVHTFASNESIKTVLRPWLKALVTEDVSNNSSLSGDFISQMHVCERSGYEFRQLRPPRRFTDDDESKTFAELDLCPNASLIIHPKSTAIAPSATNGFNTVLGLLFSFMASVVHFILTPFRATPTVLNTPSTAERTNDSNNVISQGKINRLSHRPKDSDDENARWNGNSTSQL